MAREQGRKLIAQNKKARHDYFIESTVEAGIVLVGTEVKSLRAGRASLVDAFAQFSDDELYLHGLHIAEYAQGTWTNHAPRRKRKLARGVDAKARSNRSGSAQCSSIRRRTQVSWWLRIFSRSRR